MRGRSRRPVARRGVRSGRITCGQRWHVGRISLRGRSLRRRLAGRLLSWPGAAGRGLRGVVRASRPRRPDPRRRAGSRAARGLGRRKGRRGGRGPCCRPFPGMRPESPLPDRRNSPTRPFGLRLPMSSRSGFTGCPPSAPQRGPVRRRLFCRRASGRAPGGAPPPRRAGCG